MNKTWQFTVAPSMFPFPGDPGAWKL